MISMTTFSRLSSTNAAPPKPNHYSSSLGTTNSG